ncbi:nitrate- and nitrite sensing domain-containing protein [Actinophytocola sp.]|uniref:sensor histidine kinase n=1 Tax=Actinophytocola sp. TaxID=1872138 RepID=UPI002ED49649
MSGRHKMRAIRLGSRFTLSRLSIGGKLNLLLLLPLVAVLLVSVPFVIQQVDDAGSAGDTADTAQYARELGGLVTELQRERLVTVAFLADAADRSELERAQGTVDQAADAVRGTLEEASDELSAALVRLGSLTDIRRNAFDLGVSPDSVARTYHAVIDALIDALRLVPRQGSDAEGTRQLTALEALLRANEENTLRGMSLIVTSMSPETGAVLLDDATAQAQSQITRFVQQAGAEQAGLVVAVERGDEGRKVEELASQAADPGDHAAYVVDAYTSVDAQSKLRGIVQDRVTNEIAEAAADRAASARTLAWTVGLGAVLLFVLVAALATVVSRSISHPLRRLTVGAAQVAELAEKELVRVGDTEVPEQQVPRLAAIEVASQDELGALAAAFNRVQSTAGQLVERQALMRRNVGLMFANVAQRTQNLVGRQLALVDELERNEQDTRLLERLYRLDHLSTRLRRTADNLLVVAGSRDEKLGGPTELSTALRSALAEIEDYQRVQLGEIVDIIVPATFGSDLVLVFAELLENATSFSPPESMVEVRTAFLTDGSCTVSVVDRGMGMSAEQFAEENQRLVARERLDIAPTSMLGLFVVGRLARRHRLNVRMVPTDGGGVTVYVVIPPDRFGRPTAPLPAVPVEPPARRFASGGSIEIPPAQPSPGFSWFPDSGEVDGEKQQLDPDTVRVKAVQAPSAGDAGRAPAGDAGRAPASATPGTTGTPNRGGLRRRVAGAQLPGSTKVPAAKPAEPATPSVPEPRQDPAALRGALDGFQAAFAKAAEETQASPPPAAETSQDARRGGLTRRVPGSNMAPGLRKPVTGQVPANVAKNWRQRDPDADRAKFDSFTSGLAHAAAPPPASIWPAEPPTEKPKGTQ